MSVFKKENSTGSGTRASLKQKQLSAELMASDGVSPSNILQHADSIESESKKIHFVPIKAIPTPYIQLSKISSSLLRLTEGVEKAEEKAQLYFSSMNSQRTALEVCVSSL